MDRSIAVNVILVICVSFVFSHNFLTGSFPVAVPAADATNPTIDLATEVAELATTTTTPSSTKTAPAAVVVSRGHIIARKVQDVRRLYSSTTAHEETVTNEVSEKTYEDMEFLCHHYYKDEFVVSAHVTEGGCQLECVFLKSSGLHGDSFFDTSVKKHHNINEGQNCDTGNSAFKCINGTCIEPPETGKAVISIINGTFANQADEITQYSAYVKVFLDQKYLMKTRTIEGSNKPIFNQAFVTPVITSDTQIGFIVFDRDEAEEKLLLTVQMTVDFILAMKLNGSVTCQPLGSPKGQLCFSIKWLKELR